MTGDSDTETCTPGHLISDFTPGTIAIPYIWQYVLDMSSRKVTFTLDETTVARLARTAEWLGMPKSQVVREAISEYSARVSRLSDDERDRLLRAFDELVPQIPRRPLEEVEQEIRDVRQARREGGRKHGAGGR
jgi:predicted transcriptional regulator